MLLGILNFIIGVNLFCINLSRDYENQMEMLVIFALWLMVLVAKV